jgi:DnaJ family protein C protein 14
MNENEKHLREEFFVSQQSQQQQQSNYQQFQGGNQELPKNENFSFLSDGRGNFLKIYYDAGSSMQNIPNKYELFSNDSRGLIDGNYQHPSASQFPQQEQPQQSQNNLINQLIHQWTPNVSGTYMPFGEPTGFSIMSSPPQFQSNPLLESNDLFEPNNKENSPQSATTKSSEDTSIKTAGQQKRRIVAEVKPMRMSYSDVLSKNVAADPTESQGNQSPNGQPIPQGQSQVKNAKKFAGQFEKKPQKVPVQPVSSQNQSNGEQNKKNLGAQKIEQNPKVQDQEKAKKRGKQAGVKKTTPQGQSKELPRKTTRKSDKIEDSETGESDGSEENFPEYYNVRKNNTDGQQHNVEKIRRTVEKKPQKSTKEPRILTKEKQTKRTGKPQSRKRQKHEILLKLVASSWNYLLVFLGWLYSLILDVVYLSFGIIYDRLASGVQMVGQFYRNIREDLRSNSGRPGAWLKNLWKKFDARFEKQSRWAFWRYLFERKKLREEASEKEFMSGKLPTTADEAMKSLLNCKGKDAYSILGVTPNCSQEQIRKHYKKIVILVHPDKNKQPGAEEAFKILQRSFELIGEPVSFFFVEFF